MSAPVSAGEIVATHDYYSTVGAGIDAQVSAQVRPEPFDSRVLPRFSRVFDLRADYTAVGGRNLRLLDRRVALNTIRQTYFIDVTASFDKVTLMRSRR